MAGSFKVSGVPGGTLRLAGVIDHTADLGFFARLRGENTLDLAGVRRIDSVGVRLWMEAIRAVPPSVTIRFIQAPPPIVEHINMVTGFLDRHALVSFYAPVVCSACGETGEALVLVESCRSNGGRIPAVKCAKCDAPADLDEVEARYLAFLQA